MTDNNLLQIVAVFAALLAVMLVHVVDLLLMRYRKVATPWFTPAYYFGMVFAIPGCAVVLWVVLYIAYTLFYGIAP